MFDLGQYEPPHTLDPVKPDNDRGEVSELSRLTTTEEQRLDVRKWMLAELDDLHENAGRAKVIWANLDPTIVIIECNVEHLNGRTIRTLKSWSEQTEDGAEFHESEAQRFARLDAEVEDLHERKML